jgi:hypothetical protein
VLNDKAFVEFAQALGARALRSGVNGDGQRIEDVFRRCTGRRPSADEVKTLTRVLAEERAALAKEPAEAKEIVKGSPVTAEDVREHAAWTMVARVVLNLDETITRE